MDKKLQSKMFKKFNYMFRERKLTPKDTCMCQGITCGDGWYYLIYGLCERIQKELDKKGNEDLKKEFAVNQVKEKLGGLRFYVYGSNSEIDKLIDRVEKLSFKICEHCGKDGKLVEIKDWRFTLCKECRKDEKMIY